MINYITASQEINLDKDCNYTAVIIAHENDIDFKINFTQPGSRANIFGLNLVNTNQNLSINTQINHLAPNCQSNTIIRGICQDNGISFVGGNILVAKDAENSIANFENKNLLLSKISKSTCKPELEIYNDNVKCSHGATCGYLDHEALFYLQSRGLDLGQAQEFILNSFIEPIITNIKNNNYINLINNLICQILTRK